MVTPQVNAAISYPSYMNAPKSSSLKYKHHNLTPHTEIVTLQINALISYHSYMDALKSSLLR